VSAFHSTSALSNYLSFSLTEQSPGAGKVFSFYEAMMKSYAEERTSSEQLLPTVNKFDGTSTEEQLFDNCADLKILTSRYAVQHMDTEFRKQLFNQLDWLLNPEDWEAGDNLASFESFKTLIKFILNANPIQAPFLGLSDKGDLLATWVNGKNKLYIESMPQERTKWFIIYTNGEEEEKLSGNAKSIQRLIEQLYPFKQAGWFQQSK
jgi:hypothetical protein